MHGAALPLRYQVGPVGSLPEELLFQLGLRAPARRVRNRMIPCRTSVTYSYALREFSLNVLWKILLDEKLDSLAIAILKYLRLE